MAALILTLLVTYLRPSELLASGKKDLPPLPPLLTCWSIVIRNCRNPRWVGLYGSAMASVGQQALVRTQSGKSGRKNLEFRLPCSSKNIQECNRRFGTQRHDYVPNAPQWSQHRSGARFQDFARSAETKSVESVQQCHKTRQKQSSGDRLPLSPPKQAGNTRATCRGIVNKAIASRAAHKRITGACIIDVFGGDGFLTKATNLLGLRGHALDTKVGPSIRRDRAHCFSRIRLDVTVGKCVARKISPPRQHTSCSSKVVSATAAIDNLLHRARTPWILEHPCDSWLWDVQKNEAFAAQPRTVWALACYCLLGSPSRKGTFFGSEPRTRIARRCAGTGGRSSVTGRKTLVHPKASAPRSVRYPSGDHTRPDYLSRLPWFSPWTHDDSRDLILCGIGSSLNASNDFGMGVTDLALIVNQSQWLTQYTLHWLAHLALSYVKLVLIARTDLLTNVTLATQDSHSLENRMTAAKKEDVERGRELLANICEGIQNKGFNTSSAIHDHIAAAIEAQRPHIEERKGRKHQYQIAERVYVSVIQCNLVHKPVHTPQVMKNLEVKAASDKA